jgi:RNA polymerase sigma-70 factor (ECF subfamily)
MNARFGAQGRGIRAKLAPVKLSSEKEQVCVVPSCSKTEFSQQLANELRFLRRMVRRWHRDKANADDLVQDTVLQALANAHLWQPGSNLRAWLLTIMRNQFLAATARAKRYTELLATISEADRGALDLSEPRLLLRDVERAIRRLPAKHRAVLLGVGVDGRAYEQVAFELGISVAAVRCHLARARIRLRAAVEGGRSAVPFAPKPALRLSVSVVSRTAVAGFPRPALGQAVFPAREAVVSVAAD